MHQWYMHSALSGSTSGAAHLIPQIHRDAASVAHVDKAIRRTAPCFDLSVCLLIGHIFCHLPIQRAKHQPFTSSHKFILLQILGRSNPKQLILETQSCMIRSQLTLQKKEGATLRCGCLCLALVVQCRWSIVAKIHGSYPRPKKLPAPLGARVLYDSMRLFIRHQVLTLALLPSSLFLSVSGLHRPGGRKLNRWVYSLSIPKAYWAF